MLSILKLPLSTLTLPLSTNSAPQFLQSPLAPIVLLSTHCIYSEDISGLLDT